MKKNFYVFLVLIMLVFLLAGCRGKTGEVPEKYKNLKNLLTGKVTDVKRAKDIYDRRCSVCHGTEGRGDGKSAREMHPPPTDFTNETLMSRRTDGELFYWIKEGKQGTAMIPFDDLPPNDIWMQVKYIRSFSK